MKNVVFWVDQIRQPGVSACAISKALKELQNNNSTQKTT
jgi:hypothetical protein